MLYICHFSTPSHYWHPLYYLWSPVHPQWKSWSLVYRNIYALWISRRPIKATQWPQWDPPWPHRAPSARPPKWPAWKVSMVVFIRKLEVVHKNIGGCLISYNLQLACVRGWRLSDQMHAHCRVDCSEWWIINQWFPYEGIELLWQLKSNTVYVMIFWNENITVVTCEELSLVKLFQCVVPSIEGSGGKRPLLGQ